MKMRKLLYIGLIVLILAFFAGCSGLVDQPAEEVTAFDTTNYTIDYEDENDFEKALNDGTTVEGTVVRFVVQKYESKSIWGHNSMAGEHLNFISDDDLSVAEGDRVEGLITEQPTKHAGSWKIKYLPLSINADEDKPTEEVVESVKADENIEVQDDNIEFPLSGKECLSMKYSELEKNLKDAGYSNITVKSTELDSDSSLSKDSVVSIKIEGTDSVSKGEKYKKDIPIVIEYAVIKEKVDTTSTESSKTELDKIQTETKEATISSVESKDIVVNDVNEPAYKIEELSAVLYATSSVNVRETPEFNGNKLGSLNTNDEVSVTGKVADGWYRIKYDNGDAYVKSEYFSDQKPDLAPIIPAVVTAADNEVSTDSNSSDGGSSNFNSYDNPEQQQTEETYVLNKNTKKFHYPSCDSVKRMSPKNYATSSQSREELINAGYEPCQNCHP